jgi:hypothetical protein
MAYRRPRSRFTAAISPAQSRMQIIVEQSSSPLGSPRSTLSGLWPH